MADNRWRLSRASLWRWGRRGGLIGGAVGCVFGGMYGAGFFRDLGGPEVQAVLRAVLLWQW